MLSPEDANRDKRVDLEDAILHLKEFAKTAENHDSFVFVAEKTISTLKVLAGVNCKIGPNEETKSKASAVSLKYLYLPTTIDLTVRSENSFALDESSFSYQSISKKPVTPPPERAFFLKS